MPRGQIAAIIKYMRVSQFYLLLLFGSILSFKEKKARLQGALLLVGCGVDARGVQIC